MKMKIQQMSVSALMLILDMDGVSTCLGSVVLSLPEVSTHLYSGVQRLVNIYFGQNLGWQLYRLCI